jgi:hypothetical protein
MLLRGVEYEKLEPLFVVKDSLFSISANRDFPKLI